MTLCEILGTEASLIDTETVRTIEKAAGKFVTALLDQLRRLAMAPQNEDSTLASVMYKRTVAFNTHLHVQHSNSLELRTLRWLGIDQIFGEPLLGLPGSKH